MTWGSWWSNIGNTISNGFHNLGDTLKSGAIGVWHGIQHAAVTIQHGAEAVGHEVKSGAIVLHQDVRDLVGGAANVWKTEYKAITHAAEHIVDTAGKTITGTASSLATPLTFIGIAAAAVAGIVILKK